jgi:Ca-activated chloride channel family protein
MSVPDLERGETVQVVFDLDFPNHPLGQYRVMAGRLSYVDANTGMRVSTELDFMTTFTADAGKYSVPVHQKVGAAAQVAAASKAVEKTIMGLKTGQLTAAMAAADLAKTQAMLMSEGKIQEAQEVTIAMRALQSGDAGGAQKTLMGTMVHLDQGKSK